MNKIILASLILITSLQVLYTQDNLNIDKGKKYKFALIDDTEISGVVMDIKSASIDVKTSDGVVTIVRDKILYVTADSTPEKYKYSFALLGGASFLNGGHSGMGGHPGFHLNLAGMYYFNGWQGVKVDLSASFLNSGYRQMPMHHGNIYPPPRGPEGFEGGESVYITFKPSFVLGQLAPQEKTIAYGYAGVGVNYIHRNGMHNDYNENYPDTMQYKSEHMSGNQFSGVFGIGGGLGFRMSPKLSILGEAEFNFLTTHNFQSYVPVRIGLSYSIY